MTNPGNDAIVAAYLGRLDAALGDMPESQRRPLVDDISAHITEARDALPESEASLRELLDRVGTPDEIARAAGVNGAGRPKRTGLSGRDVLTSVLLIFGALIFGVGWFVGLYLLWTSEKIGWVLKVLCTVIWPFGLLSCIFFGVQHTSVRVSGSICKGGPGIATRCVSTGSHGGPDIFTIVVSVLVVVAPFVVNGLMLQDAARSTTSSVSSAPVEVGF